MATTTDREPRTRPRIRRSRPAAQNSGLFLAIALLVVVVAVYVVLYATQERTLPGGFELTSTVNNALPLVFAALGQALIILTGGIDLSVGGLMDLTDAIAATHMHDGAGSILLWSVVILLVGAAAGLLNGLLVAYGRLQPILVTLGTLAILQGLALKVLPQPGGQVPHGLTTTLADPDHPYGLIVVAVAGAIWWVLRRTGFGAGIRYGLLEAGWLPDLVRLYLRTGLDHLGLPTILWYGAALAGLGEIAATANDDEFAANHLELLARLPYWPLTDDADGVDVL